MRARLEVRNPGELLLPNMFVQIDLSTNTDRQHVLMVPRDAVIITGEREVVIKDLGKGHFQPVEVTSGSVERQPCRDSVRPAGGG